jgi:hypothetical protein
MLILTEADIAPVRIQVWNRVYDPVKNQVHVRVRNQVCDQVRDQVWNRISNQFRAQVVLKFVGTYFAST